MKNKITGLVLTCLSFVVVVYTASTIGAKNDTDIKVVEVSELGLNSAEMRSDKLNRLIKEYEFVSPEETPWQTCQQ